MRRALRRGGRCTVEIGGRRRVLMYDPRVDRPARSWMWPFSLLQSPTVRYVVFEDEKRVSSHIYSRPKLDEAIGYFLRGVEPAATVSIDTD